MAVWIVPALKAILPHIGSIVSAAVPVFTKKNTDTVSNQTLLQQQITELQTASSQNALHIKEIAAQLQSAVTALEQAALVAEARHRRVFLANILAIVLATCALGVSVYYVFLPL